MTNGIRLELEGDLSGRHIVVDDHALTMGFYEDLDSGKVGQILSAIAAVIVDSDLPGGHDKAGLRKLQVAEFRSVADAIKKVPEIPKAR